LIVTGFVVVEQFVPELDWLEQLLPLLQPVKNRARRSEIKLICALFIGDLSLAYFGSGTITMRLLF
jgi:ArsR family metal-binding transcriptional regulator